jgi:hypothetical protein
VALGADLAGALAGLVLPVVMMRSLSLAPVPDPSSGLGEFLGALVLS